MIRFTSQAVRKVRENSYADGVDETWRRSSLQTRAASTGNARLPTVDNYVRRMISDDDDAEQDNLEPRVLRTERTRRWPRGTTAPFHV